MDAIPIQRALFSVSDKTGLIEFASILSSFDVEILSTGGTATFLTESGFKVTDVSAYTKSPEILDGRVKTLHPKVHGGILAVRDKPQHEEELQRHGIDHIDMVVANLYPFESTVSSGADFATCVENIDVGGPSMIRSAAKNHRFVSVVCSPSQYAAVSNELQYTNGALTLRTRQTLASAAFSTTAQYDAAIARHFASQFSAALPADSASHDPVSHKTSSSPVLLRAYEPYHTLKYGCNPHQTPAAVYRPLGRTHAPYHIIHGTPGYINILDAMHAWQLVMELSKTLHLPAAASFKHVSPAGVGVYVPLSEVECACMEVSYAQSSCISEVAVAYIRARQADPLCSFGDFVAVSEEVDASLAALLLREVSDGIIAPAYTAEALDMLRSKKHGHYLILCGHTTCAFQATDELREVAGVALVQPSSASCVFNPCVHLQDVVVGDAHVVNTDADLRRDLTVACVAVKYTQSNSVSIAWRGMTTGIGAGQQSRVDCVSHACGKSDMFLLRQHANCLQLQFQPHVKRQQRVNARVQYLREYADMSAQEQVRFVEMYLSSAPPVWTLAEQMQYLRESSTSRMLVLASDGFFPFSDSVEVSARHGVRVLAQPGGSQADADVCASAKHYDMMMIFTHMRLFHH